MSYLGLCLSYVRRLLVPMLFFVAPLLCVLILHDGLAHADATSSQTAALPPAQAAEHDGADTVDEMDANSEIIRGFVISQPVDSIGLWVIRTTPEQTRTVLVKNQGALKGDLVPPSSWVYIETKRERDGLAVAKRVRLDNYEPGQVVARLASGVAPDTIAKRYHLTISSTLL
ncbi:MAG TPA: hypothetical protein PKE45_17510, partial [Caldilineaceae bacterium]|nr:hypothetical protein [Caldilineaceae bacterium]